jgi:hypothetical protein
VRKRIQGFNWWQLRAEVYADPSDTNRIFGRGGMKHSGAEATDSGSSNDSDGWRGRRDPASWLRSHYRSPTEDRLNMALTLG